MLVGSPAPHLNELRGIPQSAEATAERQHAGPRLQPAHRIEPRNGDIAGEVPPIHALYALHQKHNRVQLESILQVSQQGRLGESWDNGSGDRWASCTAQRFESCQVTVQWRGRPQGD